MKEDSVNHEKTINVQKQDLWLGMAVVPLEGISDVVWSSLTGRISPGAELALLLLGCPSQRKGRT